MNIISKNGNLMNGNESADVIKARNNHKYDCRRLLRSQSSEIMKTLDNRSLAMTSMNMSLGDFCRSNLPLGC